MRSFKIEKITIRNGQKPFFIAGPCVIENERHCLRMAEKLAEIGSRLNVDLIFKASYDKANRTSLHSFRGPGIEQGLRILERVKQTSGLPVLSDVHETGQVAAAAEVLDVLQVPALLCRQTDLVTHVAESGKAINIKKGQFLSPLDMKHPLEKAIATGNNKILLTERGSSFGYNNLVVDFRSISIMKSFGQPVVFDVTHSVQMPGGQGDRSGGDAKFIPSLARAGVAAGANGLFFEVHDNPARAMSDGPNSLPLKMLPNLMKELILIFQALRRPS